MNTLRHLSAFFVGFLVTCGLSLGLYWLCGLPFERDPFVAFWAADTVVVSLGVGAIAQIIVNMWRDGDGAA